MLEICVLGCADDEPSESFDLWYSEESPGHTSQLHNELQDPSVIQTVTIPTGTLSSPFLCYTTDTDAF